MLHTSPPDGFSPAFEVVSCLVRSGDRYLFLHRAPGALYGGYWGCPTGKIEPGESPEAALRRELNEETGFALPETGARFCETLFVRYREFDFVYHLYTVELRDRPTPRLNTREHSNFAWLDPETARLHALVPDMEGVLDRFEGRFKT